MTTSAELIVLHCTKIKESAVVVHTLSREFGRRSFIASLGKGVSMAMFLPLNIIEAEIVSNPKSDLWRVRDIVSRHPLLGIRNNLYKNSIAMFMSEVLYRTVRDGANEEGLFEWFEGSILTLDALEADFSNFHLRFLLELAVALGFAPSLEDLAPFAGKHYRTITQLLESSIGEAMLIPMKGEDRNGIAESLLKYLSYHTQSAINIQSLKVLRDIFS